MVINPLFLLCVSGNHYLIRIYHKIPWKGPGTIYCERPSFRGVIWHRLLLVVVVVGGGGGGGGGGGCGCGCGGGGGGCGGGVCVFVCVCVCVCVCLCVCGAMHCG